MNTNRRVNYKIRYAKNIERKMIFSTLQKLEPYARMDKYQYVGFGSIWFTDFILAHQLLGIRKMVSIEQDHSNGSRYTFNKPFKCITMEFGLANAILPELNWDIPSIVWLDYTDRINAQMLEDIQTVLTNAPASTIFLITVNCHPEQIDHVKITNENIDKHRLDEMRKRVGDMNLPELLHGKDLSNLELPKTIRKIVMSRIEKVMKNRNYGIEKEQGVMFSQLFNFKYKDEANMLTIGGIMHNIKDYKIIKKLALDRFDYCRSGDIPFNISTPVLTGKEMSLINSCLPSIRKTKTNFTKIDKKKLTKIGLIERDIEDYARVYKHYPLFTEAV